MKRSSYREQDYPFGQLMLTLRARIGLTQAGLADLLHISRRAVAEWEAGLAYPKTEHLKAFIALCLGSKPFPPGARPRRSARSGMRHISMCCWMNRGCGGGWRSHLPHG